MSIPSDQIILKVVVNKNKANSPSETITTVTNALIILNKHRCLNVILHFVCSFVFFIRLSLSHCHQHNDKRLYFCVHSYIRVYVGEMRVALTIVRARAPYIQNIIISLVLLSFFFFMNVYRTLVRFVADMVRNSGNSRA